MEFCFFDGQIVRADFHTGEEISANDLLPGAMELFHENLFNAEKMRKRSNDAFLRGQFRDLVATQDGTASIVESDTVYAYR